MLSLSLSPFMAQFTRLAMMNLNSSLCLLSPYSIIKIFIMSSSFFFFGFSRGLIPLLLIHCVSPTKTSDLDHFPGSHSTSLCGMFEVSFRFTERSPWFQRKFSQYLLSGSLSFSGGYQPLGSSTTKQKDFHGWGMGAPYNFWRTPGRCVLDATIWY